MGQLSSVAAATAECNLYSTPQEAAVSEDPVYDEITDLVKKSEDAKRVCVVVESENVCHYEECPV